jgi:hypothetical protein
VPVLRVLQRRQAAFQPCQRDRPEALSNRNTFIRAWFDRAGMLSGFDKLVYGEVELSHRYEYHANGRLRRAEIMMLDEEPVAMNFDETGSQLS